LQKRASKLLACLPKVIDGAWIIDSVATLPEHRGKGVAKGLLNEILKKGKNQGHSTAQLNMYIGNEPALNLYLKFGFEIVEEKHDSYFERHIGSPGMLSLVKGL
jgi:ribosomal protein S18 acetylase RimI-like enzyme